MYIKIPASPHENVNILVNLELISHVFPYMEFGLICHLQTIEYPNFISPSCVLSAGSPQCAE